MQSYLCELFVSGKEIIRRLKHTESMKFTRSKQELRVGRPGRQPDLNSASFPLQRKQFNILCTFFTGNMPLIGIRRGPSLITVYSVKRILVTLFIV